MDLNRPCCGRDGASKAGVCPFITAEISISMPYIEMEIRTLYVLLEITNDIVSLLPTGSSLPGRHHRF